jgi:hypothetical protein
MGRRRSGGRAGERAAGAGSFAPWVSDAGVGEMQRERGGCVRAECTRMGALGGRRDLGPN